MTFNEFVLECDLYPYSNEHYGLLRESSEISLMETYYENQMYLAESGILESAKGLITEGYLAEAEIADKMKELGNKIKEKGSKVKIAVINGLKKLARMFLNFLKKIEEKFGLIFNKNKDLVKRVNSSAVTDEVKKEIENRLKTFVGGENGFPVKEGQMFNSNISKSYSQSARDLLSVALSTKTVIGEARGAFSNALPAKSLTTVFGHIDFSSATHLKIAHTLLKKEIEKSHNKGIVIDVDPTAMKDVVESLTKIADRIENYSTSINHDSLDKKEADYASIMVEFRKIATPAVSATIKLYNSLTMYRSKAADAVSKILDAAGISASNKVDKKEKETE